MTEMLRANFRGYDPVLSEDVWTIRGLLQVKDKGKLEIDVDWVTAGETGRPLSVILNNEALLGGWANAIKGYVDCGTLGGSTGLLSAVNGEIRLPTGAARGAYYCLEGEMVFQAGSAITPWGSSAGFLYLGASGAGIADFDTDGRFMTVVGLTPAAGKLLSADMHTLKSNMNVAGVNYAKYLVLSEAENMILHTFSALTVGDAYSGLRILVTAPAAHNEYGMSAYFQTDITGTTAGHCYGVGSWINTSSTPVLSAGHIIVPFEGGVYTGEAQAAARIVFAGQHQAILGGAPASLHAWRLNTNRTITALIAAANAGSVAFQASAAETSTPIGSVPMFDIVGTGIGYVRLYDGYT